VWFRHVGELCFWDASATHAEVRPAPFPAADRCSHENADRPNPGPLFLVAPTRAAGLLAATGRSFLPPPPPPPRSAAKPAAAVSRRHPTPAKGRFIATGPTHGVRRCSSLEAPPLRGHPPPPPPSPQVVRALPGPVADHLHPEGGRPITSSSRAPGGRPKSRRALRERRRRPSSDLGPWATHRRPPQSHRATPAPTAPPAPSAPATPSAPSRIPRLGALVPHIMGGTTATARRTRDPPPPGRVSGGGPRCGVDQHRGNGGPQFVAHATCTVVELHRVSSPAENWTAQGGARVKPAPPWQPGRKNRFAEGPPL